MRRVGIIDYGLGNLTSVRNAFEFLHIPSEVVRMPSQLSNYSHVVLPGVGAFHDGMKNLRDRGWIPALEEEVLEKNKPFLGICLGMQLLATRGTEYGACAGLNWISGVVERLPSQTGLRVPHIGWDDVRHVQAGGPQDGVGPAGVYYFVHSYVFIPEDPAVVSGICEYGIPFAASLEWRNLSATQFHPEKSQQAGLNLLSAFIKKG